MQILNLRLLAVALAFVASLISVRAQFTFTHVGGGPTGTFATNGPGSFTLVGGGGDIWDAADEFSFAYVQVTGDFDVAVRLESIEAANRWTKAGIMARESLNPDSRMAFAKGSPSGPSAGNTNCGEDINGAADVSLMYRTWKTDAGPNGGQHEDRLVPDPGYPTYKWVRLQREGSVIRGYASTDGVNWQAPQVQETAGWLTPVAGAPTPLADTLYLGFGVSRHGCAVVQGARVEYRDLQAPQIRTQPQDTTVARSFPATFRIGLAGLANWQVQWLENGAEIPGANGRSYTIPAVTSGDNTKRISARATDTISGTVVTSTEAVLTVIDDTVAPTLVSAFAPVGNDTQFDLVYSEPVNAADAQNLANYTATGAALLGATLQADGKTVRFTTSSLYSPGCKVIAANNVRDNAGNMIAANSSIGIVAAKGTIRYHQYNAIGSVDISTLKSNPKYPNFPDVVAQKTSFEGPDNDGGDNLNDYGAEFLGFVHAPVSGEYKFFLAADDHAELYLSTDENPANKVLIAREPDWGGFRNFISQPADDRGNVNANRGPISNPANISAPVTLQAGCKYYVEMVFKEAGGGDYGSVAWQYPGSPTIVNGSLPISGAFLSPYDVPATIAGGPNDVTVQEGRVVTLSANISGSPTLTIQWYKNGSPIDGATGTSITVGPVVYPDDNGSTYHVVAINGLGTATSRTATLTVEEDTIAPTIVSASASSTFNQVQLQFSEIMVKSDIEDGFAYEITDPSGAAFAVNLVTANANATGVLIDLGANMAEDTVYTIRIVGALRDFSENEMAFDTTTTVRSFVSGCGGILFEAYHNIGGTPIAGLTSDPDFPNNPNDRMVIGPLDSRAGYPDDSHENYGARMTGVFVPPYSGNWILYLRSDDASELWLNPTGPAAAGKVKVAEELGCCRAFEAIPTAAMPLTGGQPYYIEVLYKEGGGGDYGQVAARLAGSTEALAPISARDTGAFALGGSGGAVNITQQPVDTSVEEGKPATLTVQAGNTHNLRACYQWQRDGVDIAGATSPTYTFRPELSDSGAKFTVRVSIPGMTATSQEATLTVNPDTTAPTVTSVTGSDTLRNVTIGFSELINLDDAADVFLYEVKDSSGALLTVHQAGLLSDGQTVSLTTDPQVSGTVYTVVVGPVRDRSVAENTVAAPNNTGTFTAFTLSPGFLIFESWLNIGGNAVSLLTGDPRFPNSPTETAYATAFDSRTVYADDSHESYGGRMHGVFIPPVSGNWIFYLRSDDASELWLNPTGIDPAGKVKIQEELACCTAFSAHASTPQALVAGQPYYIEGLYKEGVGGDYIQVAAKLETDTTPPNSLRPISGGSLGIYANPVGASIEITQQPAASQTVCLNPLGAAGNQRTLSNETFDSGTGGYTVESSSNATGPWTHANGTWRSNDDAPCGTPSFSRLTGPPVTVTRAGVVRVSLNHRYSFEYDGTRWDGGQLRISVNGGAYTPVSIAAFSSGGYEGAIQGNNTLTGQNAWNGDSAGYAAGTFVTSVADVGFLYPGDTISVQLVGAWDECTQGSVPNWEINSVRLEEGIPGQATARFTVAASVAPTGSPTSILWQRHNGTQWSDIAGGTGASYSFTPALSDNGARFRAVIYIPGATATSSESVLSVIQANTAPSFGLSAATVTGTEDSGASSLSGLATDVKPHSIPRTPVAFATAFDNAAGWQLFGSAAIADGSLKLTTPLPSLFGAARLDAPLQAYESVTATWKNRIGGGNGADGMSLSIGDDLATSFTGEEGTGTGLIVSIDTFDNGVALDPMGTGLEMKWRGDIVASKTIPKDNDGTGNYLRKDQFVNADLTVSSSGLVTFNYDGNTATYQVPNYAGLRANGLIFAARTGGAHDNHWVDDFSVQAFPFDTSSAEAGQTVSFNTSNDNPALFNAQPAVGADGTLTFTPAANACGQATVSVTASDSGNTECEGRNTSAAQTFVISIACVNDAPLANAQTVNTTTEQPTPITLGGTDIDGDTLTFAVTSNPANGALSSDASGNLIYTSNPGYSGPDSFAFVANDGALESAPATVSINVVFNSRPACVANVGPQGCSLSIGNDTARKFAVALNGVSACVLLDGSGSTDAEGDPLQVTWVIDGTNTVSGTQVPACLELGCHTIDMIATDGKISCRQTLEICVITPAEGIDQIVALVEGTQVERKNKRPLIATLKAAAASYEREGHIHTAANQLGAFQNKCRAQIGRTNPAEAELFINAAQDLLEAIACGLEVLAAQQGN